VNAAEQDAPQSDGYAGITWQQRSQLRGLRAVLDPADEHGKKNAFIDAVHTSAIEELLERDAPFLRALDFGCGVGRFFRLLKAYAEEVYGVDRTPEMLKVARESRRIPPDRLHLWQGGPLPFESAAFDLILSVYVLSCVPESNAVSALQELRRVVSPNGRFVLLEQIAPSRGIPADFFRTKLGEAGFELTDERPVRAGSSPLSSLAGRTWFPRKLIPLSVSLERRVAPLRRYQPSEYYDCLMVATPRG
jgi:SAM-dependent methyltransferase